MKEHLALDGNYNHYKENIIRFINTLNVNNIELNYYFGCSPNNLRVTKRVSPSSTASSPYHAKSLTSSTSQESSTQSDSTILSHYPTLIIHINAINSTLDSLFRPDKPIGIKNVNDVDTLKPFLAGGLSFELFRNKSKHLFIAKSQLFLFYF